MKKSILGLAILVITLVFTSDISAQKFRGLDKSPLDIASYPRSNRISDKLVKVVYSRPQLKGRALDSLARKEKVWRTGANEATEITFFKDVVFGGKEVKAGIYTLFTIPGESEWTVILSKARNVWGAFSYKESEDVVRVKGTISKSETSVESFSIVFDGEDNNANMHLGWANTIVSVPVKG